jgi:hypothetical protein
MSIFYITQKVSDLITGTKDPLSINTTNYFCSSETRVSCVVHYIGQRGIKKNVEVSLSVSFSSRGERSVTTYILGAKLDDLIY